MLKIKALTKLYSCKVSLLWHSLLFETPFTCKSISLSFLWWNQPTKNNRNKLILCSCPLNFLQTDLVYWLHKALWKLLGCRPSTVDFIIYVCKGTHGVSLGTGRGGIKSWLDLDRKLSIWTVGYIHISCEGCHAKRAYHKGSGPGQPLLSWAVARSAVVECLM